MVTPIPFLLFSVFFFFFGLGKYMCTYFMITLGGPTTVSLQYNKGPKAWSRFSWELYYRLYIARPPPPYSNAWGVRMRSPIFSGKGIFWPESRPGRFPEKVRKTAGGRFFVITATTRDRGFMGNEHTVPPGSQGVGGGGRGRGLLKAGKRVYKSYPPPFFLNFSGSFWKTPHISGDWFKNTP